MTDASDIRVSRPVALLVVGIGLALAVVAAGAGSALAAAGDRRACSSTTTAQHEACGAQAGGDFFVAKARCINVSGRDERKEC